MLFSSVTYKLEIIYFLTYLIWLLKVPTFQHKIGLKMKNDRIDSCSVIRSCDYSLACITVWNVCYWIQWTVSNIFFNSRQHTVSTAQYYVWSIVLPYSAVCFVHFRSLGGGHIQVVTREKASSALQKRRIRAILPAPAQNSKANFI